MTQRLLALAAALLLVVPAAVAQHGMSILSRYGIGELNAYGTARQRGMGHAGTALWSPNDISQSNPAAWSGLTGLRLQGDLVYEFESYSKNTALSYGATAVSGLQFAVPIEDGWHSRFVLGFLPVSRVGYKLNTYDSVESTPYRTEYVGNGGISSLRLGAAAQPLPFLRLGAAFEYYFGAIDQEWDVTFQGGTYVNTRQTLSTSHHGAGGMAGLQLMPAEGLTIGASVSAPASLTASRDEFYQYYTGDTTILGDAGSTDIPLRWSAGASYQAAPTVLVAADYTQQSWKDATVFRSSQVQLGTFSRLSAGIEWIPGAGELSPSSWRRLAYRLGVTRQKGYVSLGGVDETETFVTAGLSIPIYSLNRIDLALEYGWRGEDASLLGPRSLIRLSAGFCVGELFFVRRSE
jgi:hypothetical protein